MRVRLPIRRALFFVSAFIFSAAALLPLRLAIYWLALDDRALAAREALGSVWLGGLSEAQLGSVPLGDVQAQLRSLPLFVGEARVDLSGPDGEFEGAASVTRHGFGIEDARGRMDVAALFAPLPIGTLDLDDLTARFRQGQCVHADGKVSAAIRGEIAGIALANGFSGTARCDAGALLLPLASQSRTEMVNIRLFADGRYLAELAVRVSSPAMAERVAAVGFAPGAGNIYALRREGRF